MLTAGQAGLIHKKGRKAHGPHQATSWDCSVAAAAVASDQARISKVHPAAAW